MPACVSDLQASRQEGGGNSREVWGKDTTYRKSPLS